jgi:hypothetical protein
MLSFYNRVGRSSITICFLVIVTGFLLTIGCSGTIDPIIPQYNEIQSPADRSMDNGSNRELWGYYIMHLNADHTKIDVEPVRGAAFHLNALAIMEAFDPTSVAVGDSVIHDDGTITVVVTLTHPFPQYTEYTAFDVRGIVMLPAVLEWPAHEVSTPGYLPGQSALLNADGYTRRWNPTEFSGFDRPFSYFDGRYIPEGMGALCTSLVNPYKRFYTLEDRAVFLAGMSHSRHYHMSFPPGPFTFAYAVDASWDKHNPRDAYATSFEEDDQMKDQWTTLSQDFGETSYWKCDFFQGEINNRDETCMSYGAPETGAVLFSPAFKIPSNPDDVKLYLEHTILWDQVNEYDLCTMLICPDLNVLHSQPLTATNHPYGYQNDPIFHLSWWMFDYDIEGVEDEFDLSPALKTFDTGVFYLVFAYYTFDGDDGTNLGGWTLKNMRIVDANAPPVDIPGDFPRRANSMEPYLCNVTDVQGQLQCSLNDFAGGSVNVKMEVSDWQQGASVLFSHVAVEAPELFEGVAHPWTGSGDVSTYTYEIVVPNTLETEPGEYPALFSIEYPKAEDPYYTPDQVLTAYQMFNLEVEEINPPYCDLATSTHSRDNTYQLLGSQPNQHLDADFLPVVSGGAGALLFDGGLIGGNEHIMVADIGASGGDKSANTLIQRTGVDAGNAFVIESNEYNGHILIVSSADPDDLLVYNAAGTLLKTYDLGRGEDGYNEPVCLAANPVNGDVWIVGDRGEDGGYRLERWAYLTQGTEFAYSYDPTATIQLEDYLGTSPKPLGLEFNNYYGYLYLFHGRFFGSIDVFELDSRPPAYVEQWSRDNIFGESVVTAHVSGLRKQIGGGIVIDHGDGDLDSRCRVYVFANLQSGSSKLVRLDAWCQSRAIVPIGSLSSCMTLSNLPEPTNRSLVFFPLDAGQAYNFWLAPGDW